METKTTKHISLTCLSFSVQFIFVVLPLKKICPIAPLEKINYFLNMYFLLESWSKWSIERKRKEKKEEKGKSISFIYSWVKLSFSLKSFYIFNTKGCFVPVQLCDSNKSHLAVEYCYWWFYYYKGGRRKASLLQ